MRVLTGEQMGRVDRLTVERCGIPYPILMETAGVQVVEALRERPGGARYAIVCGKGNNGGDGAVVARHLWLRRCGPVALFLAGRMEELRGEARTNMEIVRTLAATAPDLTFTEEVQPGQLAGLAAAGLAAAGLVVVDALFGTGLSRPVSGVAAEVIGVINQLREAGAEVVAIDLPSGIFSDQGELVEPHVRADLTVTFTAPKPGNILAPAAAANGWLVVAPIGSPDWLIEEVVATPSADGESGVGQPGTVELVEEARIAQWLASSRRAVTAHKGSVGDVLIFAGTRGKTGAAALTAGAVLRSGAGLVTVATPFSALPLLVAQADNEVMTIHLPETPQGGASLESRKTLTDLAAARDVLAIGPGLSSVEEETRRLVRMLVETRSSPLVIDADGLNALAPWPVDLQGTEELPIVITPHPGEMARLMGISIASVQADRIGCARALAHRNGLIVVLKGARTVIAAPTGEVFVNPTGNEGMATAGSGDVLTGVISGFLAQQPAPALEAVLAGVWLHGRAGDLAASRLGKRAMMASDIRDHLSGAIQGVGGVAENGESRY